MTSKPLPTLPAKTQREMETRETRGDSHRKERETALCSNVDGLRWSTKTNIHGITYTWNQKMTQTSFLLNSNRLRKQTYGVGILSGRDQLHTHTATYRTVNKALLDSAGNSTQHSAMTCMRASLMAQWIRICLPVHGTQVRSLVQEDSTCCGATKPVCHNY